LRKEQNVRLTRPWILLAVVLSTAAHAQQEQAENQLQSEVVGLVRLLDDNRLEDRQNAERLLQELGPAALEFFPSITTRTPAEVKERLGRVRTALEREMATAAAEPRLVTLRGEMSLADALAALEEQTGNRVVDKLNRSGKVKVDFDKAPYWVALDQLLDQAELTINPYGGETAALVVNSRPGEALPRAGNAQYAGIFRFEAILLEARRDLRNAAVDGLRLTLSVTWEPRIQPISLLQMIEQIEAVDEHGRTLTTNSARQRLTATADSGISAVEMTIPFELPARDAKKIASLKGVLNAVVPGSSAVFEFDELTSARDVEQQNAAVTVVFERIRRNVDAYEVRVRVRFDDAGETLQSHRGWIYNNEAFIRDSRGNRIENVGLALTSREETEVGIAYQFILPQGAEGCTFVYRTPATILRLPVAYELRDIQLP
jgi:hypothetical protein